MVCSSVTSPPRAFFRNRGWLNGDAVMARAKVSLLHRQIARVHRRLVLQSLLNALAWCWAGAILLSAAWFLLQPHVMDGPPAWLRWTVAGGLVGAGTLLGGILGWVRSPSQLMAALHLD